MEEGERFVFITGRAGTGKSTLLKLFRKQTKLECVYLAPTGVAALNVNGETVHSFFRFAPGITMREATIKGKNSDPDLYKSVDVLVIDEISMVRADLMDCMDAFLKAAMRSNRPFGGKRVIAIGDLYQLPPVVRRDETEAFASRYPSPYFFSSDAVDLLRAAGEIEIVELDRVFRQRDAAFVELLNGVRDRSIKDAGLAVLNKRVDPRNDDGPSPAIHLTTTNAAADEINARHLAKLTGKPRTYAGSTSGTFSERDFPTDAALTLKPKARVMFLHNDAEGRWVNGSLGTVLTLYKDMIEVQMDDGEVEEVSPHTWSLYRTVYQKDANQLDQEKVGSFTQIPLRLAWATTIHKSQGKTFDRCVVDLGRGAFAAGQTYVALSRCRTLEGIRLVQPVSKRHVLTDWRVTDFLKALQT